MKQLKLLFALLVLAVVGAVFGLGKAFHGNIDPRVGSFRTSGISPDTWAEHGAEIRLGGLWNGLNKVVLSFTPWRPPGQGPAQIGFNLCGKSLGEVVITEASQFAFKLDGECQPQTLRFEAGNPFTAGPTDDRQLAVQLESIEVTSRLGVPLVHPFAILTIAAILFGTGVLFSASFGTIFAGVGIIGLASFVIGISHLSDATNVVCLWLVAVLVAVGFMVARLHPGEAKGRSVQRSLSSKAFVLCILGLVVLAAAFRFYGIQFGLPGRFHPDETPKFNAIAKMVTYGDWNPRYFLHPSLLLYTSLITERVLEFFGVGWDFNSLTRLSGRCVSALAGTGSVVVLFLIGSRLYSRFVGIFSALLLAVFPLHITSSRYMKEDALMLFLLLFTIFLVVRSVQNRKPWQLVFAGITAGLCFGTKYTGLLSTVVLASAPFLAANKQKKLFEKDYILPAIFALALVPVFFVVATPYSLLDFDHFFKGVMSERKHMLRGHSVAIDAWSQWWMYHVRRSLLPGMTSLPFLCAIAGIGLVLWRRSRVDLWILGMLLLFFLPAEWVKAKPAPQPERYMIPCLPFLAIFVAEFIRVLANTRVRALALTASVAVFIFPFWESLHLSSEVADDTRVRLGDWMTESLPRGSRVLVDWIPYAPLPTGDHGLVLEMFPPGKLVHDLRGIIDGTHNPDYDYLALSSLVYDRYFTQPFADAVKRQVIRDAFRELPVLQEEIPRTRTYGFHNPAVTIFSLKQEDRAQLQKGVHDNASFTSNPWPAPPSLESWLWRSLGGKGDWHA